MKLSSVPFSRLGQREESFKAAIARIIKNQEKTFIIETGSAWNTDNWEHQGQSTLIWNACAEENENLQVISIDINPKAVETASLATRKVLFLCGDSVTMLSRLPDDVVSRTSLLYLDSFDWSLEGNIESAHHHLCELAAVYARLPSGCLVMVDDCHADLAGKHWMIEHFFLKLGVHPFFKGYQTIWVKPEPMFCLS